MKHLWAGSLLFWFGSLTFAQAGDILWRPAAPPKASAPRASLGAPVAVGGETPQPTADRRLWQTGFTTPANSPAPTLLRTQGVAEARPLPAGIPVSQSREGQPLDEPGKPRPVPETNGGTVTLQPRAGLDCPIACPVEECPAQPTCVPELERGRCCPPGDCWWLRSEYLLWATKETKLPPLVTTSPVASLGVLGRPGTTVLFGDTIDPGMRSGGRFTMGGWLNERQTIGIEGGFFFLASQSLTYGASSTGVPLLARPFLNANTGAEDAELIANPAIPALPNLLPLNGAVLINMNSRFWGTELNGIFNLGCGPWCRWDLLAGLRYMQLDESLGIGESLLVPADSAMFAGTGFNVNDSFRTRNQFYGEQVGTRLFLVHNRFSAEFVGKVGVGITHQVADVNGATVTVPPGGPATTAPGGLLALPTNIGHYDRNRFGVIPELGVNLGYQATKHIRLIAGYNFIYWNSVVRPGNVIDRGVNPTQLPPGTLVGSPHPAFLFNGTDFWAQGVNFGVQFGF